MAFNDRFAYVILATAAVLTGLHAMRIPLQVAEGFTFAQVFEIPEMVLGALWATGFTLVVQFYYRKAPSEATVNALSKT